jgi:hypothetical protein
LGQSPMYGTSIFTKTLPVKLPGARGTHPARALLQVAFARPKTLFRCASNDPSSRIFLNSSDLGSQQVPYVGASSLAPGVPGNSRISGIDTPSCWAAPE